MRALLVTLRSTVRSAAAAGSRVVIRASPRAVGPGCVKQGSGDEAGRAEEPVVEETRVDDQSPVGEGVGTVEE